MAAPAEILTLDGVLYTWMRQDRSGRAVDETGYYEIRPRSFRGTRALLTATFLGRDPRNYALAVAPEQFFLEIEHDHDVCVSGGPATRLFVRTAAPGPDAGADREPVDGGGGPDATAPTGG